ncbi:MAG TPA: S-adenosyl-l-methionine hydroxide adenosyltransferase [Cytophagales bacterium]|jgi:S-adenosyl-L-methionine hydrolase (adenosine-forming)|nr:S-adenosyl-l-methionine hydroxide adenosyltransferase [Cytophagales bacterium]
MAIVTLLTDSGEADHYAAAIKAKILSVNPGLTIIDISHQIAPCDIAHGAFVLKSVYNDFPKGTVHLVAVDAVGYPDTSFIAVQLDDHFFIGSDNGLFGLLSDKTHQQAVDLNSINPIQSTFPEKEIFAVTAAKLASGVAITTLGKPMQAFKKMIGRAVKATRKQITGHVIRIDNYGNLITNITKTDFDILSKDKNYTIQFAREKFRRINSNYHQTEQGDCFIIFNTLGLLEIGIYKGRACDLLGMELDSTINIIFDEN